MNITGHGIPWQGRREWTQVVVSITTTVATLREKADSLHSIARQIEACYIELDGLLNTLGTSTCCSCTTVCCTVATVWYDLRDLLFLYLVDNRLPRQQITRNADRTCVHLTPRGCCLDRRERPFICTWYICAAQKETLARQHSGMRKDIFALQEQLKVARKELENLYVDAVG